MTLDEARALPVGTRVFVCGLSVQEGYVTKGQAYDLGVMIRCPPFPYSDALAWKREKRRKSVHHNDLFVDKLEAQNEWNRRRAVRALAGKVL